MPVAGAVVVPAGKQFEKHVADRLDALEGASVQGIGGKGIALVLEAESVEQLEKISKEIGGWEEVTDFQLVCLNWENTADSHRRGPANPPSGGQQD